jgi:hypothetical protein
MVEDSARSPSSDVFFARIFRLALIAAALGAGACLWTAWCEFPYFPWNDVRLAPAFAIRHGINPYPLLGAGPLTTWIYGPVGIFINLPATFAPTAAAALQTASVINAIVVLGPLIYILLGSAELSSRGNAARMLGIAVAVLLVPRPNLIFQVADHCAIAFGLLSCWCLARARYPSQPQLVVAAALCALAVWSKQLAIFVVLAQAVYLARQSGRMAIVRYIVWVFAFGMIALGVFAWAFGLQNLWLNLIAIPGRLPWTEWWPHITLRWPSLVAQIIVPAAVLLILWRRRHWPSRETQTGRFFHLAALAAVAMLPVGLAAFFKIGGDTNVLHCWDYFLPAFLLLWLTSDGMNNQAAGCRVVAVVVVALAIHFPSFASLPAKPFATQFGSAVQITARYPNALWFPQHPVLGYYADRKLWHSEDGISTRYLAGYRLPTEVDFRRYLPPDLRGVVYFHNVDFPTSLQLLPSFKRMVIYHDWKIFLKDVPAPSSP